MSDDVRVYKVDDGWVVADRGMWLDGVYESEAAARRAVDLPDEVLVALRDRMLDEGRDSVSLAELNDEVA